MSSFCDFSRFHENQIISTNSFSTESRVAFLMLFSVFGPYALVVPFGDHIAIAYLVCKPIIMNNMKKKKNFFVAGPELIKLL